MNVNVRLIITQVSAGKYETQAKVTDSDGNLLFNYTGDFERSNVIYAGYKTLQNVIGRFHRHEVTEFSLETNAKFLVNELFENVTNANSVLKRCTLERIEQYGLKLNYVIFIESPEV